MTSYDYDAPLDEARNPTPKYHAFREVIARYASAPTEPVPPGDPAPEQSLSLGEPIHLLDDPTAWGRWTRHPALPVLDDLGPTTRLALYRTEVDGDGPAVFGLGEVRDRAVVVEDQGR